MAMDAGTQGTLNKHKGHIGQCRTNQNSWMRQDKMLLLSHSATGRNGSQKLENVLQNAHECLGRGCKTPRMLVHSHAWWAALEARDPNGPICSVQNRQQIPANSSGRRHPACKEVGEHNTKLTLLGLSQALDESHGLALEATGHPAPCASVHELHELLHRTKQKIAAIGACYKSSPPRREQPQVLQQSSASVLEGCVHKLPARHLCKAPSFNRITEIHTREWWGHSSGSDPPYTRPRQDS